MDASYGVNGDLLTAVQQAKTQWQLLHTQLNEANDSRVVEQIIYQMIAAEKRYDYLLQLAKEQHLHTSHIDLR